MEGPRDTQVNTRECIVCGERAGSVAILPYRPRVAFVSVFVGPDHFLPLRSSSSSLPPPVPSPRDALLFQVLRSALFRECSSRQERTRTLSSARRDKGELCTILRGTLLSLSFSLFAKSGESGQKTASSRILFLHATFDIAIRSVNRFVALFSRSTFINLGRSLKFPDNVIRIFCGFISYYDGRFLRSPSEKNANTHQGRAHPGLRQANGIIPYFSIKRGK